jgi:hypothetical protein
VFKQHVRIVLQCALTFATKRKIALAGDVCSKPLITIKSHDLHPSNIRGVVGEIASYHERNKLSLFFGSYGLCVFWPFFGLPFLSPLWWFWPSFFIRFLWMFFSLNNKFLPRMLPQELLQSKNLQSSIVFCHDSFTN